MGARAATRNHGARHPFPAQRPAAQGGAGAGARRNVRRGVRPAPGHGGGGGGCLGLFFLVASCLATMSLIFINSHDAVITYRW